MGHDRRGSLKHMDSCCQVVYGTSGCPLETSAGVVGNERSPKMQQCQLQKGCCSNATCNAKKVKLVRRSQRE